MICSFLQSEKFITYSSLEYFTGLLNDRSLPSDHSGHSYNKAALVKFPNYFQKTHLFKNEKPLGEKCLVNYIEKFS